MASAFEAGTLGTRSTSQRRVHVHHVYDLARQPVRAVAAVVELAVSDNDVAAPVLALVPEVDRQGWRYGGLVQAAVPGPDRARMRIGVRGPDSVATLTARTMKQQVRGIRSRQTFDTAHDSHALLTKWRRVLASLQRTFPWPRASNAAPY